MYHNEFEPATKRLQVLFQLGYDFSRKNVTDCVAGAGVGVASVWEQKKLEAKKKLGNAAETLVSSARFVRPTGLMQCLD